MNVIKLLKKYFDSLNDHHRDNNGHHNGQNGVEVTGTEGDDVLVGSKRNDIIHALGGNDKIYGSKGNDVINAGDGDDLIVGGKGADKIDGGTGNNTASYEGSSQGVKVDLSQVDSKGYVHGDGGDAEGDLLKNIQNLTGSDKDDVLIGDAGSNVLIGGKGADKLIGGDGIDATSYESSSAGVSINLSLLDNKGFAKGSGGDAQGDLLKGIEVVTGSKYNDTLVGDAAANILVGGDGNDVLKGGAGDDILRPGAGANQVDGGSGLDVVSYADLDAQNNNLTVSLGNDWSNTIKALTNNYQDIPDYLGGGNQPIPLSVDINGAVSSKTTMSNVEAIMGSDLNDLLVVNAVYLADPNFHPAQSGGPGVYIQGNGGYDVIVGGNGDDLLLGSYGFMWIASPNFAGIADNATNYEFGKNYFDPNTGEAYPFNSAGGGLIIGGAGNDMIGLGFSDILPPDANHPFGTINPNATPINSDPNFFLYNVVYGGDGNDIIMASCAQNGLNLTYGGDGDDAYNSYCPYCDTVFWAGNGNDTYTSLIRTESLQQIHGEAGDDVINVQTIGLEVGDIIDGGAGNDVINVSGTTLFDEQDIIIGFQSVFSHAVIRGGLGDDVVNLSGSIDPNATIDGGAGYDVLNINNDVFVLPTLLDDSGTPIHVKAYYDDLLNQESNNPPPNLSNVVGFEEINVSNNISGGTLIGSSLVGDTFVVNGTGDFASMPQGAQILGGGGFTDQIDVLKVEGAGAELNLGELFQDAIFNGGGFITGIELVDLTAAGSQLFSGVEGLAAFYLSSIDDPDATIEANTTLLVKGTGEDTVSLTAVGIDGATWTQGGQVTGGSGTVYNSYTSAVDIGAPVPTFVTMLVQQDVNVVMG